MIAAIMQPTYLPWMGYIDLIDQSDVFLFLDTVAFSRQSWQQRNRILTEHGPHWLTVPVRHAAGTPIREVLIDNTKPWRRKHYASIEQSYRRSPHWAAYAAALDVTYRREWASLAELNIHLIRTIAEQMGVTARFELASALSPATKNKDGALVDLCLEVGATTYLSPAGAFAYLQSDAEFKKQGIGLTFHQFEHPTYPQSEGAFVPYLSVVDLLLHCGPSAAVVMRRGRLPSRSIEEMQAI